MQVCVVPDSRPSLNRSRSSLSVQRIRCPNEYKELASRAEHGLPVNITDEVRRLQGLKGRLDFGIHRRGGSFRVALLSASLSLSVE